MSERWLGLTIAGDKIVMVDAEVKPTGRLVIISDQTVSLPNGSRPKAYQTIHQRLYDYATEKGIDKAFIKESAVSLGGTKKGHLLAAELRGVAMCALGSACDTKTISKAHVSRTFGDRNVDEYLSDDGFWNDEVAGQALRVGSREAAMYLLASR